MTEPTPEPTTNDTDVESALGVPTDPESPSESVDTTDAPSDDFGGIESTEPDPAAAPAQPDPWLPSGQDGDRDDADDLDGETAQAVEDSDRDDDRVFTLGGKRYREVDGELVEVDAAGNLVEAPAPGINPTPITEQHDPIGTGEAAALVDSEQPTEEPVGLDYPGTPTGETPEYVAGEREPNGIPVENTDDTPDLRTSARELVDGWESANLDERNRLLANVRRALG